MHAHRLVVIMLRPHTIIQCRECSTTTTASGAATLEAELTTAAFQHRGHVWQSMPGRDGIGIDVVVTCSSSRDIDIDIDIDMDMPIISTMMILHSR